MLPNIPPALKIMSKSNAKINSKANNDTKRIMFDLLANLYAM